MAEADIENELRELESEADLGIIENGDLVKVAVEKLRKVPYEVLEHNEIRAFARISGEDFLILTSWRASIEILDIEFDVGLLIKNTPFNIDINVKDVMNLFALKEEIKREFGIAYNNNHLRYSVPDTENSALDNINSVDEIKAFVIKLIGENSTDYKKLKNKLIFELFFGEMEAVKIPDCHYNVDILKVVKVDEIITKINTTDKNKGVLNLRICALIDDDGVFQIVFATPNSENYNYLDVGRYIYHNSFSNLKFFDMAIQDGEIKNVSDILHELRYTDRENLPLLIDKKHIEDLNHNAKLQEEMGDEQDKEQAELRETMEKSYAKNGFITINGVKISKSGYAEFEGRKIGFGQDFLSERNINITDENLDFNAMFNQFCQKIGGWAEISFRKKDLEDMKFWIGKFAVNFAFKGDFIYIKTEGDNEYRINKNEVCEVLKKGICFDTLKEYESLLSEVSRCSIKIHNVLCEGLIFGFESRFLRDYTKIPLKINIIRDKNRHLIQLGEKRIKIHNLNALINLGFKNGNKNRDFNYAVQIFEKNTEAKGEEINLILKNGLIEYKEALRKSEELLSETIKVLGVKSAIANNEKGYIVEGKLKSYFVSENLKIYEFPSMRYICVIDKSRTDNIVGKDRLVSRLYALKNDDLIIQDINTLRR